LNRQTNLILIYTVYKDW